MKKVEKISKSPILKNNISFWIFPYLRGPRELFQVFKAIFLATHDSSFFDTSFITIGPERFEKINKSTRHDKIQYSLSFVSSLKVTNK